MTRPARVSELSGNASHAEEAGAPHILFLRPDHVGDVLLTLPAITALRRELPGGYLAYAAPPESAAIAERCTALDTTLSVRVSPVGH